MLMASVHQPGEERTVPGMSFSCISSHQAQGGKTVWPTCVECGYLVTEGQCEIHKAAGGATYRLRIYIFSPFKSLKVKH